MSFLPTYAGPFRPTPTYPGRWLERGEIARLDALATPYARPDGWHRQDTEGHPLPTAHGHAAGRGGGDDPGAPAPAPDRAPLGKGEGADARDSDGTRAAGGQTDTHRATQAPGAPLPPPHSAAPAGVSAGQGGGTVSASPMNTVRATGRHRGLAA